MYRAVTGGAEGFRHALFGPRQDVAAGSHRPSDQHRLTRQLLGRKDKKPSNLWQLLLKSLSIRVRRADLVVDRDERVVRGERAGGAFAVNQQAPLLPVHHVLLHFGDVV